jgi:alpha-glucoside transport system permease protein
VEKIISTLISVTVAVGASAALWIGANLLFDQVRKSWSRFSALAHASVGFLVGLVLHGNRLLVGFGPGGEDASWVRNAPALLAWPLIFAAAFALFGFVTAQLQGTTRTAAATGLAAVGGVIVGLLFVEESRPGLNWVGLIGWTLAIAAIGGGISAWRKHPPLGGVLIGAAIGAVLGGFGLADLGAGSIAETIVATTVPAACIGARRSMVGLPDIQGRAHIDARSRAYIFLLPALTFIFVTLIVPTIRTFYLSVLDRQSEAFVWLDNYADIFTDRRSLDLSGWSEIFTSRAFYIALIALAMGILAAVMNKRSTGQGVELGGPSMVPLAIGVTFLVMAVLSALRGTIMNNLWWVFTVTVMSTALGLAVAVLADNAKFEKVAKSIIFMPMAISLVGASIIWRFMYIARDSSSEQTGVLNAAWVGIGKASNGNGVGFWLVAILVGVGLIGLLVLTARSLSQRAYGKLPPLVLAVLGVGWFWVTWVGPGLGGVTTNNAGDLIADPAFFVQNGPWNNVWLMVILIWIQTGFAMVILSAAIKAVPTEYIEAAKVDGATTSEIFWRITLPTIAPTIGVVVTTLIVLVMKVFDIVKVTTNGQFDTQVLANDMFNRAFQQSERGLGAALAVILFLSVLPVMVANIRRMQREG